MHDGAMPDQVPGTWWRAQGKHFMEDLDVVVTAIDRYSTDGEDPSRCCGGQPAAMQDCRAELAAVLPSGGAGEPDARTMAAGGAATAAASQSRTPPGDALASMSPTATSPVCLAVPEPEAIPKPTRMPSASRILNGGKDH